MSAQVVTKPQQWTDLEGRLDRQLAKLKRLGYPEAVRDRLNGLATEVLRRLICRDSEWARFVVPVIPLGIMSVHDQMRSVRAGRGPRGLSKLADSAITHTEEMVAVPELEPYYIIGVDPGHGNRGEHPERLWQRSQLVRQRLWERYNNRCYGHLEMRRVLTVAEGMALLRHHPFLEVLGIWLPGSYHNGRSGPVPFIARSGGRPLLGCRFAEPFTSQRGWVTPLCHVEYVARPELPGLVG